jgi:hypothetical protein
MLLVEPIPIVYAQQPAASGTQTQPAGLLSPGQLNSLVAPVALYPDPILSQLLVASTYPLEIVEASQWLAQNSTLKGSQLIAAAAKQDWDASVQALVALPELLRRLNQDIGWTSDLGNAFLAQQQDVMDAVQRMRHKAQDNGALRSTSQQTVTTSTQGDQNFVVIQPTDPQVVYLPEYNPIAVWGPAPEYYPFPPIYYPPYTGVLAASAISFGVGMAVGAIWSGGWGGWGWNSGWGHGNIIVNNNFNRVNHFNRTNIGNGNNWAHNPAHRGGVPYNNRNVANRFNGNRGAQVAPRPSVGQTQQRLGQTGNAFRAGQGGANMARPGGGANAARPGGGANAFRPNQGVGGGGRANAVRPSQPNIGQRPGGGSQIGNRNIGGAGGMNRAFANPNVGGNRARMNSMRGGYSRGGGGGMRRGGGGGRRR